MNKTAKKTEKKTRAKSTAGWTDTPPTSVAPFVSFTATIKNVKPGKKNTLRWRRHEMSSGTV